MLSSLLCIEWCHPETQAVQTPGQEAAGLLRSWSVARSWAIGGAKACVSCGMLSGSQSAFPQTPVCSGGFDNNCVLLPASKAALTGFINPALVPHGDLEPAGGACCPMANLPKACLTQAGTFKARISSEVVARLASGGGLSGARSYGTRIRCAPAADQLATWRARMLRQMSMTSVIALRSNRARPPR